MSEGLRGRLVLLVARWQAASEELEPGDDGWTGDQVRIRARSMTQVRCALELAEELAAAKELPAPLVLVPTGEQETSRCDSCDRIFPLTVYVYDVEHSDPDPLGYRRRIRKARKATPAATFGLRVRLCSSCRPGP